MSKHRPAKPPWRSHEEKITYKKRCKKVKDDLKRVLIAISDGCMQYPHLVEELDISYDQVRYRVKLLIEMGLVVRERDDFTPEWNNASFLTLSPTIGNTLAKEKAAQQPTFLKFAFQEKEGEGNDR